MDSTSCCEQNPGREQGNFEPFCFPLNPRYAWSLILARPNAFAKSTRAYCSSALISNASTSHLRGFCLCLDGPNRIKAQPCMLALNDHQVLKHGVDLVQLHHHGIRCWLSHLTNLFWKMLHDLVHPNDVAADDLAYHSLRHSSEAKLDDEDLLEEFNLFLSGARLLCHRVTSF